jgi:hypothetical protein
MRFRDQMKVDADGQKRLRLVNKEDWTANVSPAISAPANLRVCKTPGPDCKTSEKALQYQRLRWGMV